MGHSLLHLRKHEPSPPCSPTARTGNKPFSGIPVPTSRLPRPSRLEKSPAVHPLSPTSPTRHHVLRRREGPTNPRIDESQKFGGVGMTGQAGNCDRGRAPLPAQFTPAKNPRSRSQSTAPVSPKEVRHGTATPSARSPNSTSFGRKTVQNISQFIRSPRLSYPPINRSSPSPAQATANKFATYPRSPRAPSKQPTSSSDGPRPSPLGRNTQQLRNHQEIDEAFRTHRHKVLRGQGRSKAISSPACTAPEPSPPNQPEVAVRARDHTTAFSRTDDRSGTAGRPIIRPALGENEGLEFRRAVHQPMRKQHEPTEQRRTESWGHKVHVDPGGLGKESLRPSIPRSATVTTFDSDRSSVRDADSLAGCGSALITPPQTRRPSETSLYSVVIRASTSTDQLCPPPQIVLKQITFAEMPERIQAILRHRASLRSAERARRCPMRRKSSEGDKAYHADVAGVLHALRQVNDGEDIRAKFS